VLEDRPVQQGSELPGSVGGGAVNRLFRAYRNTADFSGFDGVDLSPGDYNELPVD